MRKTINGITYEQVPEPTEQGTTLNWECAGCCADNDINLCLELSECRSTKMIWKEVKDADKE